MNNDEFDELDDLDMEEQPSDEQVNEDDRDYTYYDESPASYYSDVDNTPSDGSSDMLEDLLRSKGISDPENIKFEGYDGIIRNRSWNDLSYNELYNILNQNSEADPETDLDDEEIDLINDIRRSGLSPEEYTTSLLNYQSQSEYDEEPSYEVDNLTDDELFILDLQAKSDNISDAEALQALQIAKYNESVYAKQMEGIRNEYKLLENDRNQQLQLEKEQEKEDLFNQFASQVSDSIYNLNSIGTLDINLDREDQEELADFILGRDEAGVSYFGKALNDPETLTQMAWFALYGKDTFNEINSYMSDQIKRVALDSYNKGLYEGRNGGSRVVISPRYNNNNYESYDELDDLD